VSLNHHSTYFYQYTCSNTYLILCPPTPANSQTVKSIPGVVLAVEFICSRCVSAKSLFCICTECSVSNLRENSVGFFFSCFALLFWVVSSHVAGNRISVVNRPKANLKTYLPHQGCQPIISQNALLTLSLSRLRSCAVSCTRVQFSTLFLHMA